MLLEKYRSGAHPVHPIRLSFFKQ